MIRSPDSGPGEPPLIKSVALAENSFESRGIQTPAQPRKYPNIIRIGPPFGATPARESPIGSHPRVLETQSGKV